MARPAEAFPALAQDSGAVWRKGVLLFAGLVLAGFVLRELGAGTLRAAHPGLRGAAALVGAGALLTAAGLPRQAAAFAGGYVFGFWAGAALAVAAQLAGCLADFWWARAVARDWARRRLTGRWARLDRFLAGSPFFATLTLRLLPVGNNVLLNLLAGVSGIKPLPFFAATAIGYLPQTAVFALAGSGVQLGHRLQLGLGIGLFLLSSLSGLVLLRRYRGQVSGSDASPDTGSPGMV